MLFRLICPIFFFCSFSVLVVLYPSNLKAEETESKTLKKSRYITGGIVGSLVGLGIGHTIQGEGRWSHRGWIFTVAETVVYGKFFADALGTGLSCGIAGDSDCEKESDHDLWAYVFLGLRIWEIVDLWWPNKKKYQVAQIKRHSNLFIDPVLLKDQASIRLTRPF